MKKKLAVRAAALGLAAVMLLPSQAAAWTNPYLDVAEDTWLYPYVETLGEAGILLESETFQGREAESRGNFAAYLYRLSLALGGQEERVPSLSFADVAQDDPNYAAIAWAKKTGVVNGYSETEFRPQEKITREAACAMVVRFARVMGLRMEQKAEARQFVDSLRISRFARSDAAACQMMGLITGYSDGYFRPAGSITRQECAAMLSRLLEAARDPLSSDKIAVSTVAGAYDLLYRNFTAPPCGLVEKSDAVDLSYFDDAVFVGDSVSQMLQYYCSATKALGKASFLCAGSLSGTNALWPVSDQSVHPSYQGKKVLVEDGVAACGAKKVYIMLGVNNIGYGIERSTSDTVALIDRILEKAPGVSILVQSVTPMTSTSAIRTEALNNEQIDKYNAAMEAICEERGWYYLNVAEAFRDENGFLPAEYCSDAEDMGIHFTSAAAENWVEYLKTHAPARLK